MHIPKYAHALSDEAVLKSLQSDIEGLYDTEIAKREKEFGKNLLEERHVSKIAILLSQFKSSLIIILLFAALFSFAIGSFTDAVLILVIVCINALLGFFQELKALHSIEALKKMTESKVTVMREGEQKHIPSSLIVPGDIILLEEGDIVPADLRLLSTESLSIDESVLTGESVPVHKDASALLKESALPYELDNMALSGTIVIKGKAKAIAVYTAQNSYLASIAHRAQEASPQSPLDKALALFTKKHLILIFFILVFVALISLMQQRDLREITMLLIAEIVSAIPEGLPIVITLVLSIGAMALSRKKTLVRYLPTVETLGSATVIASDKTGTITQGKLVVQKSFLINEELTKIAAALANEAKESKGDPIDTALAQWLGQDYMKSKEAFERTHLYPFDTKYRLMASANMMHQKHKIFVKGAYESLKKLSVNTQDFQRLEEAHDALAKEGLRVLAFGMGDYTNDSIQEWKIEIVGLIGFLDPPKANVKASVATAKSAGIRLMMITGDNALTAASIAKEVGIFTKDDEVLTGPQIELMDDDALISKLSTTTVWARMLPEHKYRIVKLLQQTGEIVAVTGDGANDIPALNAADLGIAMGSGVEAAKATAKMIILNNDLSIIIEAIRQGRIIAANIRKSIYFLVSTSIDEIILISGAILMGYPLPLYPIQILWMNLVADSALDKTFPFVKEEGNVMQRQPIKTSLQFFDKTQIARTLYASSVIGFLGLFLYHTMISSYGHSIAVSTIFNAMIIAIWVNGLHSLKEHEPFLKNIKRSLTINPYLWLGLFIGMILQISVLVFMGELFHAVLPDIIALQYILIMALAVFLLIELRKWIELWYRSHFSP
jgi:Ca2+-transporting ATPase